MTDTLSERLNGLADFLAGGCCCCDSGDPDIAFKALQILTAAQAWAKAKRSEQSEDWPRSATTLLSSETAEANLLALLPAAALKGQPMTPETRAALNEQDRAERLAENDTLVADGYDIPTLLARIAELEAAIAPVSIAGWQPIETAPSARKVLFFGLVDGKRPAMWVDRVEDLDATRVTITHWMPLPAPPEADQMPRWAAKVDGNQAEIVEALEKFGWTVISLARLGGGVPDLLCAKGWRTVLVEVKTATGRLGSLQDSFRIAWPGELWVVRSLDDVQALNKREWPYRTIGGYAESERSGHSSCPRG